MRSLIFIALMFLLSCTSGVADPKPAGPDAGAGVQNPVLDIAPAVPPAVAGQASGSIVMPQADVRIAPTPTATGAAPGDVDGAPAAVDPVKSSASAPSGAPVAIPATFIVPTY